MSEEIKRPREFWVSKDRDDTKWAIAAVANPPVFLDCYDHVIEYSAFIRAVEALKFAREEFALMAEGEGNNPRTYMAMSLHAMYRCDAFLKELGVLK